ncbi:MAG: hypothetical protein IT372_29345 [Polyangiaceae bacterium]|nr:hypothetical protein [Polyangiaceae bacterium]
MPTLSLYTFDRNAPDQAGPFYQNHVTHGAGLWAWSTIYNTPSVSSGLVWERQDNEEVIDLSAQANSPLVLSQIDALFTGDISRRGPVQTSYITWANVPFRGSNPGLHRDWELLATLKINFHVSTPWYCSDADGTITYYVFFFIDTAGVLRGRVEGWSYRFSGGWPFCAGAIRSGLDSAVPGGVPRLQGLLDLALATFSRERRFSMLYYLPGHGTRSGFSRDNADINVSLAVLPR